MSSLMITKLHVPSKAFLKITADVAVVHSVKSLMFRQV